MKTVKTRKVGVSVVLPIPKELRNSEGEEFHINKGGDDMIVLAPKILNPFDNMEPFIMENDLEGVVLLDNPEMPVNSLS